MKIMLKVTGVGNPPKVLVTHAMTSAGWWDGVKERQGSITHASVKY